MANQSAKKKNNTSKKTTVKKNNTVSKTVAKKEVKKSDVKVKSVKTSEKKVEPVVKKVEKVTETKKFELTTRQKDLILVALVVILFVIALIITSAKKDNGPSYFSQISYTEYEEKVNNEDTFLVVIIREGCSYCKLYEPIVKKVANKYEYPVYYIDIADLSEEEVNLLSTNNEYLNSNEWGTPTTLLMSGNSVVDSISGYVEADSVENFFAKNNLVAENE